MARRPRRCAGRLGAPFLVAIISRYMHACSAALPTTTTPAPPLQLAAAARAAQPTHPSVPLCSALPGAAVALTHLESRAAQQQGSAPQWQSVTVKLLHGCAALAATCPNESAPAVAALWQAAGPVLERSKRAIQAVCLSRVLELLLLLDALPDSQRDSELVQQGQQHTALCGAVLDVLLPQLTAAAAGLSLPAEQRRPWCTWGHAAQCAAVATCGLIQPAIEELGEAARSNWDGPEAARLMRLLQAAATLALHMPASGAGDLQGADQLLALLSLALQHQPDAISGTNTAAAQLQQARQMLPLLARMASLMAQAGRSMPPLSELCTAAAWLVQFVGLLAIRCNEPECCLVRDLTEIPDWCAAASTALRMLPAAAEAAQQAQEQPAAAEAAQQAQQQPAAADAAPQVEQQPAAADAAQQVEQQPPAADAASQVVVQPATAEAADCVDEQLAAAGAQSAQQHRLSQLVLSAGVLVNGIGGQCVRLVGAQNTALVLDSPDVSAAIAELWQLHSTACRSAAWAGTRGVQQLLSSATETVHMDFHSAIAQPAIAVCSLVPRRAFNHHAGTLPKRARRWAWAQLAVFFMQCQRCYEWAPVTAAAWQLICRARLPGVRTAMNANPVAVVPCVIRRSHASSTAAAGKQTHRFSHTLTRSAQWWTPAQMQAALCAQHLYTRPPKALSSWWRPAPSHWLPTLA